MNLHSSLSPGKRRRLDRLCDGEGRFSMLAVDQRQSLRRMIARQAGTPPEQVRAEDLALVKKVVAAAAASLGTAILLDPEYGQPEALQAVPGHVGVLLSVEVSGYEAAPGGARRTRLLEEWDAQQLKELGADGVKLLIWHHPEVGEETRHHQERVVRLVGERCHEAEIPFLLEVKTYALGEKGGKQDAPAIARRKPEWVTHSARTYSAPRFMVDLLKLEFPAELKFVEEYQHTEFGRRPAVYNLKQVQDLCERLNAAAGLPWVILSAGVELREFLENVRLANAAGASGFLCGRTIWKRVLATFPYEKAMCAHMDRVGRRNFQAILEANADAVPWHRHPRFQVAAADS